MATPKRGRGRPRVDPDSRSANVHLTLSGRVYDALYRDAKRASVTVPETIRRQLETISRNRK